MHWIYWLLGIFNCPNLTFQSWNVVKIVVYGVNMNDLFIYAWGLWIMEYMREWVTHKVLELTLLYQAHPKKELKYANHVIPSPAITIIPSIWFLLQKGVTMPFIWPLPKRGWVRWSKNYLFENTKYILPLKMYLKMFSTYFNRNPS